MKSKLLIYGLGLMLGLSHAIYAWTSLDKDLRDFEAGEQLDLSTHVVPVLILDAPVAIPVLLTMQGLGYGYGEDNSAKARVSDFALVIAGTLYWFVGGFFLAKLLLSWSMRTTVILGLAMACSLGLISSGARGPIILLMLLGMTPVLIFL